MAPVCLFPLCACSMFIAFVYFCRNTRTQNHDDVSSMKSIKTCDISGMAPWSDLNHDVLLVVLMKIGVVDFIAFGGVCKSWRLLALSNKNKFMVSRTPMLMSISRDVNEKECCLEDFEGRKFKSTLPHSSGRTCVGLTCGYLILFGKKSKDFWLVNPITRHELHFPAVPFYDTCLYTSFRAIIVFSPSISEWVFVVLKKPYDDIWFSVAGKQEWTRIPTSSTIHDIHAFKGKIYALRSFPNLMISEVKLYPTPKVTLLEIKNFTKIKFRHPELVSSSENLYVMDWFFKDPFEIQEINLNKMECVSRENVGEEHALFFCNLKHGVVVTRGESGVDLYLQYKRYAFTDRSGKHKFFYARRWYFIHDCLNVDNHLHE